MSPAKKKPAKKPAKAKPAKKAAKPAPKKPAKKAAAKPAAKPAPKQAVKKVAVVQSAYSKRKVALEALSVDQLKAHLHRNDQIVTGSKGELVERLMDRIEHGNMPRCPQCGLGRIKLRGKDESAGYYCPGGYDDDEYQECSYKADTVDRPAWQFETPGSVA